jgi:4-hydroxybenzoate polyprenyltransferase
VTRDLLLFLRAPLAASAIANLLVGIALAQRVTPLTPRALAGIGVLCLATLCLYWAGMGLNDLFDLERDRELYPKRPLPSGRLPLGIARGVAWGLLASGIGAGGLGAWLATGTPLRGLFGATAVALCILAYDAGLKRWRIPGAIAMGSCRFSNALFGAYALGWWLPTEGWLQATPIYALILGGYVAALTFLSTYEDERAGALPMTGGFLFTAAAPGVILALCLINEDWRPYGLVGGIPLFGVVLAQWIMAIMEGTRARGQNMTRAFLQALWLLDLGVVAGRVESGLTALLAGGALLFLIGKIGAKSLFKPPPAPTTPSEGASQGESEPESADTSTSDLALIPRAAVRAGSSPDPAPEAPAVEEGPLLPRTPRTASPRPVPESFETKLPPSANMKPSESPPVEGAPDSNSELEPEPAQGSEQDPEQEAK